MTVASVGMVRQFPQVLLLPLCTLAIVATAVVAPISILSWLFEHNNPAFWKFWTFLFAIPISYWDAGDYETAVSAFIIEGYVLFGLWLTFVTFVSLFFITAAMHTGTMLVKRQKPSIMEGLSVAGRNWYRLLAMAAFSAFLLTLVRYFLRNTLRVIPFVGKWIYRAIAFTITAGMYLMLPVIVYERNGAWSAVKRGAHLAKETWGGILVGTGLTFTAMYMVAYLVPMGLLYMVLEIDVPSWVFTTYGIVLWAFLFCLNTSLAAMLRAALYWYATTGETPEGVTLDFVPKKSPGPAPLQAGTPPQ